MGGGHHEPFEVPDFKVFNNYKSYPGIAQYEAQLQRLGLKDNWVRNWAWTKHPGFKNDGWKPVMRFVRVVFVGFWPGLALAAGFIAADKLFITPYYEDKHAKAHGGHGHH